MHRRTRNTLLFAGFVVGTGLLVGAIAAFMEGGSRGWLYLIGAIASFALAFAPGRRIRDRLVPPDD